jgi:hypothetical protein
MCKERRSNSADRRRENREIGVPFKDSNGGTVRCERRLTPDRRVNNTEATVQTSDLSITA